MGKATPFEGELDSFGNPTCGQSFMGGTICTDAPGHGGGCSAYCQNCGGDHINDTCECFDECKMCEGKFLPIGEGGSQQWYCEDCMDELRAVPSTMDVKAEDFASHLEDWCDTTFAVWKYAFECRLAKGHDGPHSCGGMRSRKTQLENRPFTDEELAEVHRSLLGIQ